MTARYPTKPECGQIWREEKTGHRVVVMYVRTSNVQVTYLATARTGTIKRPGFEERYRFERGGLRPAAQVVHNVDED